MAANEIKLTIKVDDNGSLNVIAKKSDEAAKATDKLNKSTEKGNRARNSWNKLEKGTAQLGANTTKSFAKQASIIGTGLVPAYATLAANVFAITAAFNALRGADAFRLLEEGLNKVGAAAGRNLPYVADRLKDVTGAAISTQQAMEAVALGTASGFNQEQLEGLAKVARGASTALGRDMADAMSRLTRGAAKLEPEILDELGIMVRLDDATTAYASKLGKTSDQLSILERRQAFTNAILEQGLSKYGALANSIDPSPYDRLAAAFDKLSKQALQFVNTAVTPLLELLAGNQGTLAGATLLFGSTISRQMVPALYEGAKAAATQADAFADQAAQQQANIKTTGALPKVYHKLSASIKNGTATQEEFHEGLASLDKSLKSHADQMPGMIASHGEESAAIAAKKGKVQEVTAARKTLISTMMLQKQASTKVAAAAAIEAASALNLRAAYSMVKLAIQEYAAAQAIAALASGSTIGIWQKLRKGAFALSLSLRVLGTAFLAAIPLIGQAILIGSLFYDQLKKLWPEQDKVTQATDKAIKSLSTFTEAYDNLQQRIAAGRTEPIIEEARTLTGVYSDLSARVKEITDSIEDPNAEKIKAAQEEMRELQQIISDDRGGNYFTRLFGGEGLTTFFRSTKGIEYSISSLEDKIVRLTEKSKETSADFVVLDDSTRENLRNFVTEAQGQLAVFGESTAETRNKLDVLKETLKETGLTTGAVNGFFQSLGTTYKTLTSAVTNTEDAFSKFGTETAKFAKKKSTPFDGIIDQAVIINNEFEKLTDEQAKALAKSLPEAFRKTFGAGKTAVAAYTKSLQDNQKVLVEAPGLIQEQENALNKLNKVRGQSSSALTQAFAVEKQINTLKVNALNAEQNLIDLTNATAEEKQRSLEIERELAALGEEAESRAVQQAQINVVALQEKQKILGLQQKITQSARAEFEAASQLRRVEREIANSKDKLNNDTSVTPLQEKKIFENEKEQRLALINTEATIRLQGIEMEYDLLEAQALLLKERLKAAGVDTTSVNAYIAKLGDAETAAVAAANKQAELARKKLEVQGINNANEVQNTVLEASDTGTTVFDRAVNVTKEGGLSELDTMNERVQAMRNMLSPMMEDLKKLGPQGEIAASVAQGAFTIADSFTYAAEMTGTNMEKMGAKAKAIADTIGAINSIMQASMQASIAKIDQQIAAEKKRDGKSSASVAKLQQLEKKKEAMAKKAFDINKKMMIAQTIMNTAAAVMATMTKGGFFASPLAMIVAAMGAAQVALIAGTSYQGGGSSGGASMPSSVSVGERKSSSDLARSQGGAGELAYFRGAQGQGGPENFTPAFAGYKNRAEGGNTAFMVGEQGPELFVPEKPGRVVPNDDIQQGTPINASINISAIDAAGVEDVLMNQRGNIISMIRDAANSQGNTFLEEINVAEL